MKNLIIVSSLVCFFIGMLAIQVSSVIENVALFRIASVVVALVFLPLVVKQILIASDSKERIKAFGKRKFYREFYIIIFAAADFLFIISIAAALGFSPRHNTAVSPDVFSIGAIAIAAAMFFGIKFLGTVVRKQRIENEKLAVA